MDTNPINDQNEIETQPNTSIHHQKLNIPLLLSGILTLIIVGAGVYYLGTQKSQYSSTQQAIYSTTPIPISATPFPTELTNEENIFDGWVYKAFDGCNVKFPIPPKKEPYYSALNPSKPQSVTHDEGTGKFWDFPRGASYPNLLSKLLKGNEEYKQAATMYGSESEASGYISSAVVVSCVKNTGSLDNQGMLSLLNSGIQKYDSENHTERMEATKYTVQSTKEVNRWNKKVIDFTVSEYFPNSGGQTFTNSAGYTMFTTPQYIYEVKVFGETNNNFIKETARKIFENLQFTSSAEPTTVKRDCSGHGECSSNQDCPKNMICNHIPGGQTCTYPECPPLR